MKWTRWTTAWLGIGIAVLILEVAAIVTGDGGTFSEHVWQLVDHPVVWLAGLGLMGWMTYHFFFQRKLPF